jgi:hypothetical protein
MISEKNVRYLPRRVARSARHLHARNLNLFREVAMAAGDMNPTQGFGATSDQRTWNSEETYWRDNWRARPYAQADRGYDYYSPGYRYGFEVANKYRGRQWNDVEPDLRKGWDKYEHRGTSTWDHMKDAVRDAWNRVTGH